MKPRDSATTKRLPERRRASRYDLAMQAKDALLRAAAALTEGATRDVLAFALLETAVAMRLIATIDDDEVAREKVTAFLRKAASQRATG